MMVCNPDKVEKDYEEYNGGCWKCEKQLTLKDKQTNYDDRYLEILNYKSSAYYNFEYNDIKNYEVVE